MNRFKKFSREDMAVGMTDFVVNMIKTMHLFKDNFEDKEIFVDRNIAKHSAQICIKYDMPTRIELRPILKIELHNYDLSFDLYSLESLSSDKEHLNKEQELEVLRGLNCIAAALKEELNNMTKGSIVLVTELGQILKEAEDEQKRLLARKGSRR